MSDNLIKVTVDQMHEGIQIVDRDWRYVYLNAAAARHGRNPAQSLVGRTMMEVYPGIETTEMFRLLEGVMRDREPARMENQFVYPDGGKCWFMLYFEPHALGVLIRSIDISEVKKFEEQYLHAQKMEAIGRLAGGIAHDFNNKMAIVQIYADMAMSELSNADSRIASHLTNVIAAVEGAAKLTRQLLAFSRKQVLDLRVVNLNELVTGLSQGVLKLLGTDVRLEIDLDPELGNVWADLSQIDQVIMNLAINGRDAMPAGGVLTIETSNVELDATYCASRPEMKPGAYVLLSVSDTGVGIPPEIQSKIFDPFFTTKTEGHGTGLGLASVFGIVKQSRGQIWLYSEVGIGTTFKIYFPRVEDPKNAVDYRPEPEKDVRGTEVILLVEDDEALRIAYGRALSLAGYKVHSAASTTEAKALFMELKGRIDLLLSDVVLDTTSGRALAKELLALKSGLKIAFMSGYTENSIIHHGVIDDDAILIQKPVSMRKLLGAIRRILDGQLKKGVI
ncbi:MAG: ATP-binding protein [Bdellovibrionota bacterium]